MMSSLWQRPHLGEALIKPRFLIITVVRHRELHLGERTLIMLRWLFGRETGEYFFGGNATEFSISNRFQMDGRT